MQQAISAIGGIVSLKMESLILLFSGTKAIMDGPVVIFSFVISNKLLLSSLGWCSLSKNIGNRFCFSTEGIWLHKQPSPYSWMYQKMHYQCASDSAHISKLHYESIFLWTECSAREDSQFCGKSSNKVCNHYFTQEQKWFYFTQEQKWHTTL